MLADGVLAAPDPDGLTRGPCYREQARASGGIGRRARFRSVCPKGRGGSTPPSRTKKSPVSDRAFFMSEFSVKRVATTE